MTELNQHIGIKGVSIILCCYNSASRLPQTLEHLAKQEVPAELQWEVLLVNNNSTDDTEDVANSVWTSCGSPTELRIVRETKPGLSFARNRGMASASYDIFLFCDDDNWLDPDYVALVYKRFQMDTDLAALGGWSDPVFEAEKPEWFETFAGNFAVGKPVEKSGYLEQARDYLYGAGMVMSRNAKDVLYNSGFENILSDRKGKQLSSGGDVELIYALKLMKMKVYFDDRLHFKHFMPEGRMNWDYLLRIRRSMYWSNFVLGIYVDALNNRPYGLKAILKRILNSVLFILRKKRELKQLDPYRQLFLKNQIESRSYFLGNLYFYHKTRKRLSRLNHD